MRGSLPQKPIVIVAPDGDDSALDAVRQMAQQAQATATSAQTDATNAQSTADNARQMVRNRDPRLEAVEEAKLTTEQIQENLRRDLQDEIENRADADAAQQVALSALSARVEHITLTPGPEGKSAYDIARELGYGGTKTQWLASLKGDPGNPGNPGTPGKDGAPGKDANVDIRYRDGINVPAVSILTLGTATVPITVTWDTPFPDANYTVIPQLATNTAALIGKATPTVTSKTPTGCVITVSTTAVLALGAFILSATAIRKTT
jgi:hypothetical protein